MRETLNVIKTKDGKNFYLSEEGNYYRLINFVTKSLSYDKVENPEQFYESAVAFGNFQYMLRDYPAKTLHETIANFHNTPDRYAQLKESIRQDLCGRAAEAKPEIDFLLAREQEAGTLVNLLNEGKLPLRVTHNDTKLNNVMLDEADRTPLCVIDLDTVMPGLSAYDFGDSIRFGAATAAEDETDLSKMEMDLNLFRTYTKGFLQACPGLTDLEKQMLPMGAKLMTLEVGLRFLTDYIDGDHYFAVHREGHNLDRSRTQLKLVADMESKWQAMTQIVAEESV